MVYVTEVDFSKIVAILGSGDGQEKRTIIDQTILGFRKCQVEKLSYGGVNITSFRLYVNTNGRQLPH